MNTLLFSSYQLGPYQLKNRLVMAPMTRSRAVKNNVPPDITVEYYQQRSGAGLIITEGTSPSPNGLGYPNIPGIFSDDQIISWKAVTKAVHEAGSRIFLQLMHTGRVTAIQNLPQGAEIVAPVAKTLDGQMFTLTDGMVPYPAPREMTREDISHSMAEFIQAAKNAIEAGFDGVEIHGANGYLVEQFLNANLNNRTDEYGGSVENRTRFALEVAEGIANAIGKEKTGIRLSPYGGFNMPEGHHYTDIEQTYEFLARHLSELEIAYIHVVDHSSMGAPEVPESIKKKIRENFNGTYILSGGYDKERAEKDLQAGKGELIAFGKPFLANPDLVTRLKKDAPLNEPNQDTFYTPGPEGYIDYPILEKVN